MAIDPGKRGGVAWGENEPYALAMPDTVHEFAQLVSKIKPKEVWIEKVHTSPQMGVVSAGTFMKGVGQLEGVCAAYLLPIHEVTPQKWMRYFELGKKKDSATITDWKKKLKTLAAKLFPKSKPTLETADAILIWEYVRRSHNLS